MSPSLALEYNFAAVELELNLAGALSDGWDSYDAPAPTFDTIERGRKLLRELKAKRFLPRRIVPSAEGGVSLYFMNQDRTCYIEYRNSGEAILAMYAPVGEPEIKELLPGTDEFDSVEAIRSYLA